MKKLLITFGCSWTFGVGLNYSKGMTKDVYFDNHQNIQIIESLSFRSLISTNLGFTNLNFSSGGSSNQRQFRLAKQFFFSKEFETLYNEFDVIVVLWGITSTARNELYSIERKDYRNFFLNPNGIKLDNWPFHVDFLKFCYDHDVSVKELTYEMNMFNVLFDKYNIKNLWFDTFNHHDYNIEIEHLLNNDYTHRDLLSTMLLNYNIKVNDNRYHLSNWTIDNSKISAGIEHELLNPYSFHPTVQGHQEICNIIQPEIIKLLNGF